MNDDISTARLHLRIATRERLLAERDALDTLANFLDVRADESWNPLPDFVLEMMLARADERDECGHLWPSFYIVAAIQLLLIGCINFKSLPRVGEVEIGYELAPTQWNRGYATEAVAALCERAFSRGVARICAGVDEGNLASARVLRKNGFERAGIDPNGRMRFVKS